MAKKKSSTSAKMNLFDGLDNTGYISEEETNTPSIADMFEYLPEDMLSILLIFGRTLDEMSNNERRDYLDRIQKRIETFIEEDHEENENDIPAPEDSLEYDYPHFFHVKMCVNSPYASH